MFKIRRLIPLFIALLATSGMFVFHVQADAGWEITDFNTNLTIQNDGTVAVTEKVAVDFHSFPKHGIYRDIPYVYEDKNSAKTYTALAIQSVTMDGTKIPYEISKNQANERIKIGDPDKTLTSKHVYELHYTVTGVLRSYAAYDELYWNATGNDWEVPIVSAAAEVHLPGPKLEQTTCYYGEVGATTSCESEKLNDASVRFVSPRQLSPGQGLTVAAGYTKGLVPILSVTAPKTLADAIISPLCWATFLGVLLGGIVWVIRSWLKKGRDKWFGNKAIGEGQEQVVPFFAHETISPEFASPDNLRPAELGTLVDEQADTLDISATIVDLASRGYLTIQEIPKKWRFGSMDYKLVLKKEPAKDLLAYESLLLQSLFEDKKEVQLSELKYTFYDKLSKVKTKVYDELVKKGYFTANPETVRLTYLGSGLGILILGVILIVISANVLLSFGIGLGAALTILGVVVVAMSGAMPARTAKGRHVYRQALGYKLFITTAEKYRAQFEEKESLFTQTLPYAIVFGVTKQLAKAMEKMDIKPPEPTWYVGAHPFNGVAFASNINSLSTSLSTAIAATPGGSGSGGGGSSGGGFGGGGGGGW